MARDGTSIASWTPDPEPFGIGIRGSDACIVSGNIIFTDNPYISDVKNPPDGKKIYGILLDGYQNTGRDDFRTTNYTSVTGNNIDSFRYGIWEQAGGSVEALNNNVTNNHTKGTNQDYNLEHGGSYYEWTDHAEGDHVLAFGNETSAIAGEMLRLKRSRPGPPGQPSRPGEVVCGNPSNEHSLRVYGDIKATRNIEGNTTFSLRSMYAALMAIAVAAGNEYSNVQEFKSAIKTALEGMNDD